MSLSPMSHVEKTDQVLHIRLVRIYIDAIDINRSQHVFQLIEPLSARAAVLVSEFPAGGIDENNLSGLGVGKFN